MGDGGIILDADGDIEEWISAVDKAYNDESYYQSLCAAATKYSHREEAQPEFIVSKFLELIESHAQRSAQ